MERIAYTALATALTLWGAGLAGAGHAHERPAGSARWLAHLTEDLLPYWRHAAGVPEGSFPGRLCNDGTLPVIGASCLGVTERQASNPAQSLVAQSRQVFSYGVAFHMTGDARWLDLARKGYDHQFDIFLDAETGLFKESYDQTSGVASGVFDSQKQAYGLLGPSFLYYLTGDAEIYADILAVEQAINRAYRDPETGGYASRPKAGGPGEKIVFHLDQLNSYKTLLASQAPPADRARLQAEALQTARYLRDAYFDPATGLFKYSADTPDGTRAGADYSHSIKALWFIDQTAKLAGDVELERFAQSAALGIFAAAFRPMAGAWSTQADEVGLPQDRAHWWGFAELTQYMAALAVERPELRGVLTMTQAYWLEHFVDDVNGGIWAFVDVAAAAPETNAPKHWEWKAGFHSFEHALINYISERAREDGIVDLFFARQDRENLILPYGFTGVPQPYPEDAGGGSPAPVGLVRFTGVSYAAHDRPDIPPAIRR